jgi:hypothetical protein
MPTNASAVKRLLLTTHCPYHCCLIIIVPRGFASRVCYVAWPPGNTLLNWDCFRVNPLLASSAVSTSPSLRPVSTIKQPHPARPQREPISWNQRGIQSPRPTTALPNQQFIRLGASGPVTTSCLSISKSNSYSYVIRPTGSCHVFPLTISKVWFLPSQSRKVLTNSLRKCWIADLKLRSMSPSTSPAFL